MDPILLGKGITDDIAVTLLLKFGNRHGLVTGATGTGKTVTLKILAEGFSRMGVPVFLADIKGDLSGLAVPGSGAKDLLQRAAEIGVADYAPDVQFPGHLLGPVRRTGPSGAHHHRPRWGRCCSRG
ncbi:MAG: helicase HerA-like domain-containing protein [Stenotrophomonas sp.]